MEKKPKLTLEDLAKLIQQQTFSNDQKFDKIDQKFDQLTEVMLDGFDKINQRFEQVDQRFDKIDCKLVEHDAKFDRLFIELADVKYRLDQIDKRTKEDDTALYHDVDLLKKKVIFLEKELKRLSVISVDKPCKKC